MPRRLRPFRLIPLALAACVCASAAPVSHSRIDPVATLALLSLPAAEADALSPAALLEEGWRSGSAIDERVEASPVEAPVESESLAVPILALVLAGALWRYYRSTDYRRLYEALYGPLREY